MDKCSYDDERDELTLIGPIAKRVFDATATRNKVWFPLPEADTKCLVFVAQGAKYTLYLLEDEPRLTIKK